MAGPSKLCALAAALPKTSDAEKRARVDSFTFRLRVLIPGWSVELASLKRFQTQFR